MASSADKHAAILELRKGQPRVMCSRQGCQNTVSVQGTRLYLWFYYLIEGWRCPEHPRASS